MKKKTFSTKKPKKEKKFKKKKGKLIGNAILLSSIAILVVSMSFTLFAKLADKNDGKEELPSASDELLTISTEEPTEEPTEEAPEAPTEEAELPSEEEKIPTEWKFFLNGNESSPLESEDRGWQYALTDTALYINDGDWETGREFTGNESDIHSDVLTYDFGSEIGISTIRVEAPKAFRVAYTQYNGSTTVYKVVEYPAGIHDLVRPDNAYDGITVTVTYFN